MKHLYKYVFSLIFIQCLCESNFTQSQHLKFEHLSTNNGLSNKELTRILQDREGFMWFGTGYGLNKYNGYDFTVFKHDPKNPSHSIQGSGERVIHEDKQGDLWVVTWGGGGLNKIDKRTGRITPYPDHLNTTFLCLYEDQQGIFWIGTGKGLVKFNPKTKKFTLFNNTDYANVVLEDASGKLWAFGKNIFQFDRNTGKFSLVLQQVITDSSYSLSSALLDKEGVFWIGTKGKGLFKLNTKNKFYHLLPYNPGGLVNQTINDNGIYEDSENFLWLATTEGLQRIDRKSSEVITYRSNPILPGTLSSNNIQSVYKGQDGTLWVGTDNGINKAIAQVKPFHKYQVSVTTLPVRLKENQIQTIVQDYTGIVWLGGPKGLYKFNPATLQIKHVDANPANSGSLTSEGVKTIYEDRMGQLWVSTKEALHRLNRRTGKFVRYATDFQVIAVDETPDGILWIATRLDQWHGAIAYLDAVTDKFRYYYPANNNHGLNNSNLSALIASRTGDIWVGTLGGGINRLNPKTGKFIYYKPDYPLTPGNMNDDHITALYEDLKGFIWIGTNKSGLNRFDPETKRFINFAAQDGLPSNRITSIISDAKGDIWFGTSNGISRFKYSAGTFRNFGVSDGLPDNTFYSGSIYNRQGQLLLGSHNGFVTFHPDSLTDNVTPPRVYLVGLKVLEKSRLLPANTLELSYQENFLSFDFVALNYNSPEKNQYAYLLENLDKHWIYSNTRRYASYTGLAPGKYIFRVKASNNDGVWNEKGASLTIIIHPPWWRTWWAYLFYGFCFLTALFLFGSYQRRHLVQQERARTRQKELEQAREIEKAYHELKSTQVQLIQREKMASLGELTAGIAHEIQNPLNFVNNFSEVSEELCQELQEELHHPAMPEENKKVLLDLVEDLTKNQQKIKYHGKRADSIIKNMLLHSRISTGQKEPTDINALADEYLRLSYHGLRAKDKAFNVILKTDFNNSIGKIEVVPQEIGRVLLNLFNNAFYATQQKRSQLNGQYQPEVQVSTKNLGDQIEIRIRDNGSGIPDNVKSKIFQPFFTTKPTGQGTGLGLSLSYDIITKSHGGELNFNSVAGEFTQFIVLLPSKSK